MAENNNISGVEAIRQLIKAQKEWLPIKPGDGKNSLESGSSVQAIGDHSRAGGSWTKAISRNAFAYGFGSIAGGRGFKITAQEEILNSDGTSSGKGKYTLSSVTGIQVGQVYSVRLSGAQYNKGAVLAIDGLIVTVDEYDNTLKIETDSYNSPDAENYNPNETPTLENYFMIVGRPDLGDIDVAFNALSIGENNMATDRDAVAIGRDNKAIGQYSFAVGRSNIAGYAAYAEGRGTQALGEYAHTEGFKTTATGDSGSHAEGRETLASNDCAHAEGLSTKAAGKQSHAEGVRTQATATGAHAEGADTKATNSYAHAEGAETQAQGNASHAEGQSTTAIGAFTHAEGFGIKATGQRSHAEGDIEVNEGTYGRTIKINGESKTVDCDSRGVVSHREGRNTTSYGAYSHAEGNGSIAQGDSSHAEGHGTLAISNYSHAAGRGTIASAMAQMAIGTYNVEDGNARFIVGVGSSDTKRSNCFTTGNDGTNDYITIGNTKITEAQLTKILNLIDTIE